MVANECDFEHEGFCVVPKIYNGFVCPSSEMKDGMRYCNGDNNELMTEEEWEAQQMEEKSRMNRDDREMKGYQRK
jgi:hypothetical protein